MFLFSDGKNASGWDERERPMMHLGLYDLPKALANLLKVPGKYQTLRNGSLAGGLATFFIHSSLMKDYGRHGLYPARYGINKGKGAYICRDFLEALTGEREYNHDGPIKVHIRIAYVEALSQ